MSKNLVVDMEYIEKVNKIVYSSKTFKDFFERLDSFMINEFSSYFYSILLLEDGDNNYFIKHATPPAFYKLKNKLFPLFKSKILRRLYGFGKLKNFNYDDNNYIEIGNEIVELANAFPINYDGRIIGFFLSHDNRFSDETQLTKLHYLLNQIANSLVIFSRISAERDLNKSYLLNLKLIKFLTSLLKEREIEAIYFKILNYIFDLIDAEAGCIAEVLNGEWHTPAELGMNSAIIEQLKFKDGAKLIDFALQIGQIYNIDTQQISEQVDLGDLNVNLKSIVFIPIVTHHECNQVITLVNYHNELDEQILINLQKLSEIAATAIQNYDLSVDEDASYPEKEAMLNKLNKKLIETLETLLDEIVLE